jgi:elongation factor 1-beta
VGEVAVLFRILPTGVETDLNAVAERIRAALPAGVQIRGMQVKEIAYGLKSLLVAVVMPDLGGLLPSTEEAFAKIPDVQSVEVMEEGLL